MPHRKIADKLKQLLCDFWKCGCAGQFLSEMPVRSVISGEQVFWIYKGGEFIFRFSINKAVADFYYAIVSEIQPVVSDQKR